jgi:uroporphyrin-III C-methyltransferase
MNMTLNPLKPMVYLIGAGPGSADLITVRGMRILERAEIVFHDALIDSEMLSWCKNAKLVPVGKRCGAHSSSQTFINKCLIDATEKYSIVVRLKGGDPLIFGRAAEEISALKANGVQFEVIPGITTALAASASLQQPPTSRKLSRTFTITTLAGENSYQDHPTKVFYMGRDQLGAIAKSLEHEGFSPTTPVCLIESVSLRSERKVFCYLNDLLGDHVFQQLSPTNPLIVMVGEVYRDLVDSQTTINLDLQGMSKVA